MAPPTAAKETTPLGSVVSYDEKWNHSMENIIRKSTIGLAVGIFPSLILARSLTARCGVLCFCIGTGAGIAYREARYLFDHNVTFDTRYICQLQLPIKSA